MECVTLLLGENHVEVSREDLISKSKYFAALFSPQLFEDLQNFEHRIDYDIRINTLQVSFRVTGIPASNCDGIAVLNLYPLIHLSLTIT